jgi:hypothetical protein
MAKENKERAISAKALTLLTQLNWDSFDSDCSWLHLYLQARADFPKLKVTDLFMLSKIERMCETKLISEEVRDTLCEVYLLRTNIDLEMNREELDDDTWDGYQERLEAADAILSSYGVAPMHMQQLIDSTIEKSKCSAIKERPVLSEEQREQLGMSLKK